jgi:hypothetical protein
MGIAKTCVRIVSIIGMIISLRVHADESAGDTEDFNFQEQEVGGTETESEADSSSARREAIQHFQTGVRDFDARDYQGALASFQRAYDLNPSWKLFYNIGHCQAALKYYGLAVITFERYLAEGGDAVSETRRDEVLLELERMRKMVGDIEVVAPVGLDVFVDGIYRGVTPLPGPLSVSAGALHHIELKENDEVLLKVDRIVRGETRSEVMYEPRASIEELPATDATEPAPAADKATVVTTTAPPPSLSRKRISSKVPFFIAAGSTVLLGGSTVALGILVKRGKENMDSDSDAKTLNAMRIVGLGTLLGTAGAGITTIVLAAMTDFKGPYRAAPVAVYATPSEGGLLISGSF